MSANDQPNSNPVSDDVLGSANDQHNSIPVSDDVLGYFFAYALNALCDVDVIAYVQMRAVLQMVCRTWRRVAITHPAVWYLVWVDGNTPPSDLALNLERSGVVPLRVVLDISEFDRTQSEVREYFADLGDSLDIALARCVHLTVCCEALVDYEAVFRWLSSFQSSTIRHLTLDMYPTEDMTNAHASSMPVFPLSLPSSLSVVHSLVLFGSLITPTNLTKLVLDSVGHDGEIYAVYLMDGLKSCVGLTHLHLIHLRTMDVPSRTILEFGPCLLPNVTHLHVVCSHLSSCYFVTALQLPALTSLKFEGSGNRLQCLLGDKRGYRNQAWGSVQVLSLVIQETPHTIANVLPDFPGLRHLDIRSYETSDMAGVWQGVYLFTQHNSLCPRLEMIHVGCELTEDDVRSILRSRPLGHFASSCGIASYVWGPLGGLGVCQYKAIGGHVTMDDCGSRVPEYLDFD